MAQVRLVLLVAMGLVVGGCSAMNETWDEWFGDAPAPTTTPAIGDQSEVFYAAIEGLALHELPSGSSEIVARLSLHQRVTRTGLARGYANVTTEAGIAGWVDNAQLLWRLPSTPAPTAVPAAPVAPGGGEVVSPASATPEPPVAPVTETPALTASPPPAVVETPLPVETAASEATPTSSPAPSPTRRRGLSGLFDPF